MGADQSGLYVREFRGSRQGAVGLNLVEQGNGRETACLGKAVSAQRKAGLGRATGDQPEELIIIRAGAVGRRRFRRAAGMRVVAANDAHGGTAQIAQQPELQVRIYEEMA